MKRDPKVRKDGLCARRGCTKPLQKITERHRRYGGALLEFEPFCSSVCCRIYHGTTLAGLKNEPDED